MFSMFNDLFCSFGDIFEICRSNPIDDRRKERLQQFKNNKEYTDRSYNSKQIQYKPPQINIKNLPYQRRNY